MQFKSCGREIAVEWDAELQSWAIQIPELGMASHCPHWSDIDGHVATVIEAYG